MPVITGVTASTAARLAKDAGVIYHSIDVSGLEDGSATTPVADAQASGTLIGATRGGSTFTRGLTLRNMPADGLLGPTKGFRRRENVETTLQTNILELTDDNLQLVWAGANKTTAGAWDKVTGGEVADADYKSNIALFVPMTSGSGDTDVFVLVLENVLPVSEPDLATSEDDEMVLPVTFGAHFASGTPTTEPWAAYLVTPA